MNQHADSIAYLRGPARVQRRVRALLWGLALVLAGLAAMAGRAVADPVIRAVVDRGQVPVGGVIMLTVELEGFSRKAGEPQVPQPEGFELYDAGSSRNVSWVNGQFSSSTTYSYQLVARKAGQFTLGPIVVEDKGHAYRAEALPLEVTATPAAGGTPPDRSSSPVTPQAAIPEGGLWAEVQVDKQEAYLDEQITVRFLLFQRGDISLREISGFQPPSTEGFWREDLGAQRDYRQQIDGEVFQVREIAWAVFPTQVGNLTIGPGRLTCHVPDRRPSRRRFSDFFSGSRFNSRPVPLASAPVEIRVKPLPEAERPADFTGTVGQYEIEARFDGAEARQGEPLALSVAVRGRGHIQTIGAPVWPAWEDLRVYDSGESVSLEKRQGQVIGEKVFTQVLIPTRSGTLELGPIRFAYFDPQVASYRTASSQPLTVEVLPAARVLDGGGPAEVLALGQDILYIRTELTDGLRRLGGPSFRWQWLVHLMPLGLLAGATYLRRRRAALENDPARARRARALRGARQALGSLPTEGTPQEIAGGLAGVLEAYLSDWLGQEVRGLRRVELASSLGDLGLDRARVDAVLDQLAWADEVRFGAGAHHEVATRRGALPDMLTDLEATLRGTERGGIR